MLPAGAGAADWSDHRGSAVRRPSVADFLCRRHAAAPDLEVDVGHDQLAADSAGNGSGPQSALQWFVDPYRPARLYVLDATSAAVQRSDNGGSSWHRDDALTQAISESGSYSIPLADSFYDVEAVLTDMQFDPDDGGRRFALGYAGAFFTVDG